jgi:hypothetical protein
MNPTPLRRHRGIYEAVVYSARLEIDWSHAAPGAHPLAPPPPPLPADF